MSTPEYGSPSGAHRRVGGRVGSAGLCTPFFSASLVKLMEGPPVYAWQAGGGGTACSGVATQYCYSRGSRAARYVHAWPGRGEGHSRRLLVPPPTLYVYLPWTWPPFPYLPTQKATTPFLLTYLLDYLDLPRPEPPPHEQAAPAFPLFPFERLTCLIFHT